MVSSSMSKLVTTVAEPICTGSRKVTIAGIGNVGMAIAINLLSQNITNEVCLVSRNKERISGEMKDLQHASKFINNARIMACTDYECSKCSRICIVSAGVGRKEGDSRLDLLKRNADVAKDVVSNLVKHSPDATLLMVANPVDVLTYVAWKASGLPINRVIGSGTLLDSSRFVTFIAEKLGIGPSSINGLIIGEHGESAVACWSTLNVGGARLVDTFPDIGKENDPDKWYELRNRVVNASKEVIAAKGATWWAVALAVTDITRNLLNNTNVVLPVTTNCKDVHGISDDIFFSLPCVLGLNGISQIVVQHLSCDEKKNLDISAEAMRKAQQEVGY